MDRPQTINKHHAFQGNLPTLNPQHSRLRYHHGCLHSVCLLLVMYSIHIRDFTKNGSPPEIHSRYFHICRFLRVNTMQTPVPAPCKSFHVSPIQILCILQPAWDCDRSHTSGTPVYVSIHREIASPSSIFRLILHYIPSQEFLISLTLSVSLPYQIATRYGLELVV